jgi:sortase (surface protein transpeptidase)
MISRMKDRPPNSNKPENIINSLENFNVPGKPEKKTHMKNIHTPKLGVKCNIPETSTTYLELYLR